MFRGSKEFPHSVEGTIELTAEMSCALYNALNNNPEAVEQLKEMIGAKKFSMVTRIFSNAFGQNLDIHMTMAPPEDVKIAYSQIAKAELKRMEEQGENGQSFSCGHSVDTHKKALEKVIKKTQPTTQ